CWSLESGVDVDVDAITLSRGADAVAFAIGQAILARLQEIFPSAAAALPAAPAAVGEDFDLAVGLAQAAYHRTGAVAEGGGLASRLAGAGAADRAEAVLAEVRGKAKNVDDRLRWALGLSLVRFWGRHDLDGAITGLSDAVAGAAGATPALLAEIYAHLAEQA